MKACNFWTLCKQSSLIFLLISVVTGCTNQTSTKVSEPAVLVKKMPNSTPDYTEPKGWARNDIDDIIRYTPPEGDLVLALVPINSPVDAKNAAHQAWMRLDKNFQRDVQLIAERPAEKGWDNIWSISYQTSPSEERVVMAWPHQFGDQWSVVLLDGHLGTVGKRSAAGRTMLQSLTRAGYQAEDLSQLAAKPMTPAMLDELLGFVDKAATALQVPGVGIGIIENGKVVFSGGVGVKNMATNQPIDDDTRFMIASNTKGMTTLLLAKLVEMGRINWDDPVVKHYPEFKLGDHATTQSVLIKHLVCACTGLPRKDYEWLFNNAPYTPANTVFTELAATQPTSGFGEIYQYNNQMAGAAGYVAAHLFYPNMEVGKAYDRAMQEVIFDPLGMSRTTFDFAKAIQDNAATPYTTHYDGKVYPIKQTDSLGFNHTISAYRPAGAAWSTPNDMLKYIHNELTEGVSPKGTRLFAREPLLARRQTTVETGANASYGMGLSTKTIGGIEVVEHGGSMAGYKSQMVIIPSANVGAVILTNSDMGGALLGPFRRKIIELLYSAEPQAMAQVMASAKSNQQYFEKQRSELTIPADPKVLSELAKVYVSPKLGKVEIIQTNDNVMLDSGVWQTTLGSKVNPDGTTSIVLTSDAMLGVDLVVGESKGKRTLTLITPQHSYTLTEVNN